MEQEKPQERGEQGVVQRCPERRREDGPLARELEAMP